MKKLYILLKSLALLFVLQYQPCAGSTKTHSTAPVTGTIYVNISATGSNNGSSWTNAYTNLQTAISAATAGDIILVAAGTYYPTALAGNGSTDRDKSFVLPSNVEIHGGYNAITGVRDTAANPTILSGDIGTAGDTADNCYHVIIAYSVNSTVLDGFTITGANANGFGDIVVNGFGLGRGCAAITNRFSSVAYRNLIVTGNSGTYGGALYDDSASPTIINCIFSGNNVSIYHINGMAIITNCTFSGNTAAQGADITGGNQLTVTNSIFYGSNSTILGTSPAITYSLVQGGYNGTGNINVNPLFVSSTDFHLQSGSPCINAGSNAAIPADVTTDLDGNVRIQNTTVDMGAYEIYVCAPLAAPTASAQTFCTGATVTDLTATGDNLQWYTAVTGGSALASTNVLSTGTYYVSQTFEICESDRTAVSVTINTTPAPTASAQTFCTGATVANLVANGSSLNWYAGATGGSPLSSTTALTNGTYYVSQTLNSCESTRTAVSVIINITAAPTASAQTFCIGATVANLVANGSSLNWYAGATGGSPLSSTTALTSGTYYVSQTLNTCESTRTAVSVTINTTPAPTASSQTFCTGATVANLIANGSSLNWYAGAAGGSPLVSTTTLTSGTYYVSQTLNSCESTRTAVSVIINTTPAPTASSQAFCTGATVANLVANGSSLNWYAGATGGSPLASTTTLTSGTYYVSQTLNSCESTRTAVSVIINSTTAPTASAQTFCTGATVADLTATGDNLQWYADATGGSVLASTDVLSTGTYYVSQTLNSCESTRTAISVTINTTTAPTASAQTFCTGATVADLTATGDNLQWYADATGGSVLASTDVLSTGTYYVSQTLNSCESTRTAVSVTINIVPAPGGQTEQTVNAGTAEDATIEDLVVEGTGILWYQSEADILNGNPLPEGTLVVNGAIYYATQTTGSCESEPLAVTVTVILKAESFEDAKLSYYPNPVNSMLRIVSGNTIRTVEVYTMFGQKIISEAWNTTEGSLTMAGLESATYLVHVYGDNGSKGFVIVKE